MERGPCARPGSALRRPSIRAGLVHYGHTGTLLQLFVYLYPTSLCPFPRASNTYIQISFPHPKVITYGNILWMNIVPNRHWVRCCSSCFRSIMRHELFFIDKRDGSRLYKLCQTPADRSVMNIDSRRHLALRTSVFMIFVAACAWCYADFAQFRSFRSFPGLVFILCAHSCIAISGGRSDFELYCFCGSSLAWRRTCLRIKSYLRHSKRS